jgi:ribose transport system ATP-binding protein
VEIARAVHRNAQLIIMDEPTASLTSEEVQRLFEIIRRLKELGVSIIYISHHLEEVFDIADRVTVLRDGNRVITTSTRRSTRQGLIQHMVGGDVKAFYPREAGYSREVLLEVSGLCVGTQVRDVGFTLHKGEVLAIYGLIGAGQETLSRALFGLVPPTAGEIKLAGRRQRHLSPGGAIDNGIGFVPADRKTEGLVLKLSVKKNLTLPILDLVSRAGVLSLGDEDRLARRLAGDVRVRSKGLDQSVTFLSGGNQQKVVLGKWLARGVKVLLLNEPTRGVDVGAKAEIYELIQKLTREGVGVLLVSSDLPEVRSISDRIGIMVRGRLTTILDAPTTSQEEILQYATAGETTDDATT